MFDEEKKRIRDLEQFALDRRRHCLQDMAFFLLVRHDHWLVLGRDLKLYCPSDLLPGGTARKLANSTVLAEDCRFACLWVFGLVSSVEFHLEAADSLAAFGVVAGEAHFCRFTEVILVAVKSELGVTLRFTEPEDTTNLVRQSEVLRVAWELLRWLINENDLL